MNDLLTSIWHIVLLLFQVKVDRVVIAMERDSTLTWAPGREPHYQLQFSDMQGH